MNSEFGELSQARYRARTKRRRFYVVVGLLLIALGYVLMAVSPDTPSNTALARVLGGLACIVIGFGLAILPKKVLKTFIREINTLLPRQAPAITSLWPPIYFVAEYKTKSAPCFNGCCHIGPMYVLSTAK